eukprot:760467-Hanusia_phi.AAC.12
MQFSDQDEHRRRVITVAGDQGQATQASLTFNFVPFSKQTFQSMCTTSPDSKSIRMLSRCRSPRPVTYPTMLITAMLLACMFVLLHSSAGDRQEHQISREMRSRGVSETSRENTCLSTSCGHSLRDRGDDLVVEHVARPRGVAVPLPPALRQLPRLPGLVDAEERDGPVRPLDQTRSGPDGDDGIMPRTEAARVGGAILAHEVVDDGEKLHHALVQVEVLPPLEQVPPRNSVGPDDRDLLRLRLSQEDVDLVVKRGNRDPFAVLLLVLRVHPRHRDVSRSQASQVGGDRAQRELRPPELHRQRPHQHAHGLPSCLCLEDVGGVPEAGESVGEGGGEGGDEVSIVLGHLVACKDLLERLQGHPDRLRDRIILLLQDPPPVSIAQRRVFPDAARLLAHQPQPARHLRVDLLERREERVLFEDRAARQLADQALNAPDELRTRLTEGF